MLNLVLDFDGTMADTFKPSPNEIGVSEAYCLAVDELFGEKGGKALCAVGGLQNRAPIELIHALQAKGIRISGRLEDAAENLVKTKMEVLLREITPNWPLPCAGYAEFNEELCRLSKRKKHLRLAILSSGHTSFIERTLKTWKKEWESLFWPSIIISDDNVRQLPISMEKKIKPSPFLFQLVREKMSEGSFFYFGDDPAKDGMLAVNAGVPFGWFSSGNKKALPSEVVPFLTFSNWKEVAFVLEYL